MRIRVGVLGLVGLLGLGSDLLAQNGQTVRNGVIVRQMLRARRRGGMTNR